MRSTRGRPAPREIRAGNVPQRSRAPVLAASEATRRWTTGTLPQHDPYLRTGEVLVAHVTGEGSDVRVVALEQHRPATEKHLLQAR